MNEALKAIKSTLRLPASKFPPRPLPASLLRYTAKCDELYEWQRQHRPADKQSSFTLHDGPPYANGELHVGHALNKITKDIICRSQLAQGKKIDFVPGWDCHGLPIEQKVSEKHGWGRGDGVDPVKIRGAARGFAEKTVEKQMKVFRSWGIMADWNRHWKTMDKDFELRQLEVFKAMVAHGLILRRFKPVYWSVSSQTALAEAEVERAEHTSTAAIVKFRIPAFVGNTAEPVHAVIWTTTPWTIPSNQAIAIHKDMPYVLVRSESHGIMIVARTRVEYLAGKLNETVKILQVLDNDMLLQSTYSGLSQFGPEALDRPFIHADFVTADEGTGLVHCAPGHGNDDYEALQDYISSGRVIVKAPVNDAGEFNEAASPGNPSLLSGKNVLDEGNAAVLKLLRQENVLIADYEFQHKYPIDWRTKKPIMIRATAQWFTDISKIKMDVLSALEDVQFHPPSGKSRLKSFVESRSEWCISRQRAWGVPIPAIYHKETGEAVLTPESVQHIMDVIKQRGINAWWSDSPDESAWIDPSLDAQDYRRGTDTMDVWFDSGTSWMFMADQPNQSSTSPVADVYFEGSDQHRGWFQSSILTNVAYQKSLSKLETVKAPYRQLITHGFTLDSKGKKMSKSLGNVISPDQIIAGLTTTPVQSKKGRINNPLGPDALRLWAASGDWSSDVIISEKVVSDVHKSLDRYRVTFKVLLGMLADFNPNDAVPHNDMAHHSEIHRLALLQLYQVVQSVRSAMATYEFHKAVAAVNRWLARDLSGMYLEAIKDSVYCDDPKSLTRLTTQTVLYHIFCELQGMLGPILPLLIEETYEHTPQQIQQAAHHPIQRILQPLPDAWNDSDLENKVAMISNVNAAVKAAQEVARAEKVLGQSLASEVTILLTSPARDHLVGLSTRFWEDLLVVSSVHWNASFTGVSDVPATNEITDRSKMEKVSRCTTRAAAISQHYSSPFELEKDQWVYSCGIEDLQDPTKVYGHVLVTSPSRLKCVRCWKYTASPSQHPEQPGLCTRCEDVISEHRSTHIS